MKTKKYEVLVEEIHTSSVVVEAKNEKEAREKALKAYNEGDIDLNGFEFSGLVEPISKWPVSIAK